jgi:hypothetical protein
VVKSIQSTTDEEDQAMNISFEIPSDIVQDLCTNGADLNDEAREVFLVELYRLDRITHHQLAEALGLSRLETEGVLKRHKVSLGITAEEMRAQVAALGDSRPE